MSKRIMGVLFGIVLMAMVAIVAIFVASNKAEKAVATVAESHIDAVASAEADAASIRAAAEADAASIRSQAQADADAIRAEAEAQIASVSVEETVEVEAKDDTAFEQITVNGQQIFVGDSDAIIEYLSSLTRQSWLDLAVIEGNYYARVLPCQTEVVRNSAFVSAYRMTKDQCEYNVLRNGALLVENATGNVIIDNNTVKVAGVNDCKYPRAAYAVEAEALYEGYTKAVAYTRANAMGSLKVSCGFDRQEIFNALVVAEGDIQYESNTLHGYFVAWRVVEGPVDMVTTTTTTHHNGGERSPSPTVRPTTTPHPEHEPEATLPPKQGTVTREEQEQNQPAHEANPTLPPKQGTVTRDEGETTVKPTAQPTVQPSSKPAHGTGIDLGTVGSSSSSGSSAPSHGSEQGLPAMGGQTW